ncbi:DUF2171 domain-containing protein [Muricoccus radiodurans]|uniref:DUF2171 domain-containing protein n=1 Tax=Muricoccus radiodurans TaxID=2231721 RepID=UPI003CFB2694
MVNAARIAAGEIQDHMPVIASDGQPIGTVDGVEGDFIKLTKTDPASGGEHRYIPLTTVAGLDGGVVRLSMPSGQAAQALVTETVMKERLSLDPDAGRQLGQEDREQHSRPKGHELQGNAQRTVPGAGGFNALDRDGRPLKG